MHKCNQCGHEFEGNFCPECGTAVSVESTRNSNSDFLYSEFVKEKKQCKVLLMLLNNMDIEYLKERALKVLDLNPDNTLAQMIYDCDFKGRTYEGYCFLELNEEPLRTYIKKEMGNIDAETCLTFMCALVLEAQADSDVGEIAKCIMENILSLHLEERELFDVLKKMARVIGNVDRLAVMLKHAKLAKVANVLSIINGEGAGDNGDALKGLATIAYESRKRIARVFKSQVERAPISQGNKTEVYTLLGGLISQPIASQPKASENSETQEQPEEASGKKIGGWMLIVFGIVIAVCIGFLHWVLFIIGGAMIAGGAMLVRSANKK